MNTYGDGGDTSTSLYPKGWGYLISTIDYLYSQGAQEPGFRGVDFFEFEGLEMMWNSIAPPQSTRTTSVSPATANSACSVIYNRENGSLILKNAKRDYQMSIYSLQGKLITQLTTGQTNEFSMNHLAEGGYIVSLSCESELPLIYKFIK